MILTEYKKTDKEFLLKLSQQLTDFELPARIKKEKFQKLQYQLLLERLENLDEHVTILILREGESRLGFIELETEVDWVTDQKQGYISRIVVADEAQGKGLDRQLMAAAEDWGRQKEYQNISLNVFMSNQKAVGFYEKLGFEIETVKMIKRLN